MNTRQRFVDTLDFKKVDDRLPVIEWAAWWDKTIDRWRNEGLPSDLNGDELFEYLNLDIHRQYWIRPRKHTFPKVEFGMPSIFNEKGYHDIKKHLYPQNPIEYYNLKDELLKIKEFHDQGDFVVWITVEGFFWYPRTLFGIENHIYAFYDYPELMHEINQDLVDYNIKVIEEFCRYVKPDFMTFAEDMSYNHGPMLSYGLFKEFLLPYYKQIIPVVKNYGIIPFVDTDGNLEEMIPWLIEAGIEGVLPLERQSGVDVARIRRNYPGIKMIGGYDKMVMNKGEEAMRQEFERLLPVMKSGGFIPSCDHQTPPAVSLEEYRLYIKLLREYCKKAVD